MKKIAILLTSMGTLFLVGISVVTLSGINQLSNLQVKADPVEYSITFDANNTSPEEVDIFGDKHVIFSTTNERGARFGMFGYDIIDGNISFANYNVWQICFFNNDYLTTMDFDHFTGVKVVFTGSAEFFFESDNGDDYRLTSDVRFSRECVPTDRPRIETEDYVAIDSITIYYTC